jgi:subtilisin family serine protease
VKKTPWILFFILVLLLPVSSRAVAADPTADSLISRTPDGQTILRARRPSGGMADFIPYAPDELLVRFKEHVNPAGKFSVHRFRQATAIRSLGTSRNLELVKLSPGASLEQTLKSYRDHVDVLYAEPNYLVEKLGVPNDPSFTSQWNLRNTGQTGGTPGADIKAVQAWDITTGSSNVVVAIIDTGIDYNHQDLVANMWRNEADCNNNGIDDDGNGYIDDCHGIDTFADDADPMDDDDHGTHVAGIIGAVGNNSVGIAGVSWNVKMMACKFLGSDGFGTVADAIDCLEYIVNMKARGVNIVATNNSWGAYGYSQALYEAIKAQLSQGTLFIAAAGNSGLKNDTTPLYPASYDLPNVISVAASDDFDGFTYFSNFGRASVHLMAPGWNILSTTRDGTYSTFSGTSMAAPHVTGIAALLKSQDSGRDWRTVKNLILAGGDSTWITSVDRFSITGRRANAYGSLKCSNSVIYSRVAPRETRFVSRPVPIKIAVLHVNCAKPNGSVTVMVSPTNAQVLLKDDGLGFDEFAHDGIYTGSWLPPGGGVYSIWFPDETLTPIREEVIVTVDPDLKAGFPVKTFNTPGMYMGGQSLHTLVANIDSEPDLEIIVTGLSNGPLYAWKSAGTPVPGWPLQEFIGAGYAAAGELSPAIPGAEISAGYYGIWPDPTTISGYTGSGTTLPGWPRTAANYITSPPALADVDGDGIDEIFTGEEDSRLHGYRSDGSVLSGWPTATGPGGQGWYTPAIADLDGDGRLEIVTQSPGYLSAYHDDGRSVAGFPVRINGSGRFPVIGDVDGDGSLEIVIPAWVLPGRPGVELISGYGTIKRSIPAPAADWYTHAPALADLDGDGTPEIIFQTDTALNVWRGDGSSFPGWPVTIPARGLVSSSPVVGDVDGDGLPDIVVTAPGPIAGGTKGQVLVYNRNGILHSHFPKMIEIDSSAVPAIADLDGDGRNEIVITGDYWDGFVGDFDKVWVYDLGGPAHGPVLWGQLMGGPKHQGYYNGGFALPRRSILNVIVKGPIPGTVKGLGINCGTDCTETYIRGALVTLSAIPPAGSYFAGWKGGGCQGTGPCTVKLDSDIAVTAIFGKVFTLTVLKVGNGDVMSPGTRVIFCGHDCSEEYNAPARIILTATPAPGEKFAGWVGGGTSCLTSESSGYCNLYVDRDITLTAFFGTFPDFTLVVNKIGSGRGIVTSSMPGINCGADCQQEYALGQLITVTATPDTASTFAGWSGACNGIGACTLTMDGNKNVTATFTQPLAVHSSVPPEGEVGLAYNATLAPGGGLPPYSITMTKGHLPPGLALGSPEIVGTPSRSGTYAFTIRITDQLGSSVSQKFKLKIVKALAISTKALTAGRVGKSYKAGLKSTGGIAPATWAIIAGALPDGLTFDPVTRRITGVPALAGTFNVTFQVTDPLGGLSQKSFAMLIKP